MGGELHSIIVTQGRIDSLAVTFTRTWQRPPSQVELEGLIRDYIKFGTERRFTFTQVYLNSEQRCDTLAVDSVNLLTELHPAGQTVDISTLGNVSLLEPTFESVPLCGNRAAVRHVVRRYGPYC